MEIEIAPLGIGFILLHITAKITKFIVSCWAEKSPKFIQPDSLSRTRKQEMEIHRHPFSFISVPPCTSWSSWSSISSLAKVFSGYPYSPESHQSSLTKGVSVQCSEPLQEHLVMLKMAMPDNIQWIWFCCICVFLHLYKQQKKLLLDIFVNVDNLGSPDYLNIIMNIDGSETYLNIQT